MEPGTDATASLDPGHEGVTETDPGFDALRVHRAELYECMQALELALAAPPARGSAAWVERVNVALIELTADLREHISLTEGADGLYRALLTSAPRLSNTVDVLTRDHSRLKELADDLLRRLAEPDAAGDVDGVREAGTTLLSRLSRHRQRGADLVWDAYQTDIGGET
jgi:hypothetical protein